MPDHVPANIDETPLRRMREARGLTQEQFGGIFGLHQAQVSRMENATRPFPVSPSLALQFAEFFGAWCGPDREMLFIYPVRYKGRLLPFEAVALDAEGKDARLTGAEPEGGASELKR